MFSFPKMWIFVPSIFFTTDTIRFLLLIIIRQYFVNNKFCSLWFCYLIQTQILIIWLRFCFPSQLFNVFKYFIDSLKNIKVFFVRINSNKFTIKFLFYCFLSFYFAVNISVALSIFINFYCKLIIIIIQVNPIT